MLPASHAGVVFVDPDPWLQQWRLSNVLTGESVVLQYPWESRPELVFDDDGSACVASPGHDPILVDEAMHLRLVETASSERWLATVDESGEEFLVGQMHRLLREFNLGTYTAAFGAHSEKKALEIAYFRLARHAERTWGDMVCVSGFQVVSCVLCLVLINRICPIGVPGAC